MKIVIAGAIGVFFAASAAAVDITAVMREANAATVSYVSGTGNAYSSDYDCGNLFDGNYESTGRWLDKNKPSADKPIVISYVIDPLWTPQTRPVDIVVSSFTLHLNCNSTDRIKRMPTVFSLEASDDGESWTTLYAVDPDNPVIDWEVGKVEYRKFEIPSGKRGNYRMFRFCVTGNNGGGYTGAQELVLEGDLIPVAVDQAAITVFSDAMYWFRGAEDKNGDGVLQSGEMVNALRLSDPDHSTHTCTVMLPRVPEPQIRER